jgi:hypothetical protein
MLKPHEEIASSSSLMAADFFFSAPLGDLGGFDSGALRPCQQASLFLMFANAHRTLR